MQTEEAVTQEAEESVQLPDFAFTDMCYVCKVAPAYVRVRTAFGDLLYCGHHYASREPAVIASGYQVRDERARALASPRDIKMEEREYGKDRRRHN